jgi:hypothetical protein
MPIYLCKNCTYSSRKRHLIIRHLNNKTLCRNRVIKCSLDTFYSDYLNEPVASDDDDDDFDINSQFTDCTLLEDVFQIIDDNE